MSTSSALIAGSRRRLAVGLAFASLAGAAIVAMPTAASAQYRPGWSGGGPRYVAGPRAYGPRYYGPRYGYRRGWGPGAAAAGIVGGLALGALAAGALAPPVYAGPVYPAAPVYGGCYLERQRVWTDYGWRWRRVEVCP